MVTPLMQTFQQKLNWFLHGEGLGGEGLGSQGLGGENA